MLTPKVSIFVIDNEELIMNNYKLSIKTLLFLTKLGYKITAYFTKNIEIPRYIKKSVVKSRIVCYNKQMMVTHN